jgi:general secretion pathway protein I
MPIFIRAAFERFRAGRSLTCSGAGRLARGIARRPETRSGALSRECGFTLLEMLVALAIFSLAGLALVRLQAVSARSAFDLRNRTMADLVARNLMVERMTDPVPPAFGNSDGTIENGGRAWHWRQGVAAMPDRRLIAITIRVDGGPGQSPAVISFLRPVRR